MYRTAIAGAVALSVIGVAVLAHNGATGVVLDRMNGMAAMRDEMRDLARMMQGQVPYDVRRVQSAATALKAHSGDNMNSLFPQGPIPPASFAKSEIWEEWDRFAALSEELTSYATGLATAAPNGLAAAAPAATEAADMATMDHSTMQMAAEPKGFSVAELMGVAPALSDAPVPGSKQTANTAQTTPIADRVTGIDFSMMAAPRAFEMIGQTCAACHALFRNES